MQMNLQAIASIPAERGAPAQEAPPPPQRTVDPMLAKKIIEYCKHQFSSYHQSAIFQNWRTNSEAIVDAVEQRYRTNEQVTRSGFYLAAMRAEFDGLREGMVNVFAKANPLFVFRKKPGFSQAIADKVQNHVNDEWERMDGMEKFYEIGDDVWQFGTGISYAKWQMKQAYGQFPSVVQTAWGEMLDWQEGFQEVSSGPDIERIHPMNWAGDFRRNRDLSWEGCMREWRVSDVMGMQDDDRYFQDAVQEMLKLMKDGKSTLDPYFYHPYDQTGGGDYKTSPRITGYEYWGDLNGVEGFENDPHEYVVVWADEKLLRWNHNPIYIGGERFRPFDRSRSNKMNNFPMGRSILAPNLPHQKLQNLMVNLGVDDLLIRQHLGMAVWWDTLENPNDLMNPEGARGFVWMKNGTNANMLPRFIEDRKSGIMNDSMEFMDRFIKPDMQKSGINDLSLGIKEGAANGTATAAQLLASVGNRRTQSAVINLCKTGLRPIAKKITMLALRNRPMQDLPQFTSRELLQVLESNEWDMHDAVTQDPYQDAMGKAEFYNMAKDVIMQITSSSGDAGHVIEMLRDIARDKGIRPDDFDRYFPLQRPPVVNSPGAPVQPPTGALPPFTPAGGQAEPASPPAPSPLVPEWAMSA